MNEIIEIEKPATTKAAANTSFADILQNHATPLYVFDLAKLKNRVAYFRSVLPESIEICYAMKANPFVVKPLSEQVDYLEICSPGELKICQNLSVDESKFIISGIYKAEKDIAELIGSSKHVAAYTVESLGQFRLLRTAAQHYNKKIKVLLRLSSKNQFGIDRADLTKLIADFANDEWIEIAGLQYFSGTQKSSIKKIARECALLDDYLTELKETYNFTMPKLEFGPGFPVAYFEGEQFDEESYMSALAELLKNMHYAGPITLEIGRSLTATCGTYFTRVVDMKQNCSENYAIVDGGMHQIVYYGHFMAMKHPRFSLLPPRSEGEKKTWHICGSLCTMNDFLAKQVELIDLKVGDILAFENAGAYCMTEGMSLFLSRDLPEIILLNEDKTCTVVRKPLATGEFNTPHYEKE